MNTKRNVVYLTVRYRMSCSEKIIHRAKPLCAFFGATNIYFNNFFTKNELVVFKFYIVEQCNNVLIFYLGQ